MTETFGDVITWAQELEEGARKQALNMASLPFVEKPLAVMADGHQGYGVPVGSVVATNGAIVPYCAGVDLGCGVIASRLSLTSQDLPDDLGVLHGLIRSAVPSGVGKGHEFASDWDRIRHVKKVPGYLGPTDLSEKQVNTLTNQLGTLGSGNHFVELCLDEQDRVWLMLHSGSRGIGNQLATHHINIAKGIMKEIGEQLPDPDLAYLLEGSQEFDDYIYDMRWSQNYALRNREVMMSAALDAVRNFFNEVDQDGTGVDELERINCHHNFTEKELVNGKMMWVTRKGAIKAYRGDLGVIPGSMATGSYITEGLGSSLSYNSSSHGAGRKMSRGRAKRELSVESLNEAMKGKTWNDRDAVALLDEHPDAYKDITSIMEAQKDLVKIKHHLTTILNYKGL